MRKYHSGGDHIKTREGPKEEEKYVFSSYLTYFDKWNVAFGQKIEIMRRFDSI